MKAYSRPEIVKFGTVETLTQLKSYGSSHPVYQLRG
jgi:hypothetical protein